MGSKTKGWGSCVSWVWGPTPRKVTRASGAWALDPDPTGLCAPGDVTQNTQLSTDCPTYKSSLEEAAGGGGCVLRQSTSAPWVLQFPSRFQAPCTSTSVRMLLHLYMLWRAAGDAPQKGGSPAESILLNHRSRFVREKFLPALHSTLETFWARPR